MVSRSRVVSPASPLVASASATFRGWAAGLVILAVVLAYANSLSAPLVLDDYYSITENPTIRQLWPPGSALSPPAKSGTGDDRLANYSYALSYALSRERPWGYDRVLVAGSFAAALRARWRLYRGLASSWLALAWLMIGVKERDMGFGLGASAFDYALTASKALVVYLRLALWPQPLIFDRGPRW